MEKGVWRLWLHTPDFVHGTYLLLYPNGTIERITTYEDMGDDVVTIKGTD